MIDPEDWGVRCRWCGAVIIQVHCGAWVNGDGEEDCPDRPPNLYQDHEPPEPDGTAPLAAE